MSDWDNLLDDRSSRDGEDTDCRGVGDQVLEHHRAEVLAFFRRQRSLRPEDARDMAQETLFRALRRGRLDTVRNVRAYLLQVARNLFRERGRRGRLVRFVPLEEIDSGQIRDVAPSPEAVAIGREQLAAVLDARDDEFVVLRIEPAVRADRADASERVSDADIKAKIARNVVRADNGDVRLKNIPMVDQGPKGYCAPAT